MTINVKQKNTEVRTMQIIDIDLYFFQTEKVVDRILQDNAPDTPTIIIV